MKATISSEAHIVPPPELRALDRIQPGQQFEVERLEAGRYLLTRIVGHENEGLVDWLLSCPEKGWFQRIPSESTDDL